MWLTKLGEKLKVLRWIVGGERKLEIVWLILLLLALWPALWELCVCMGLWLRLLQSKPLIRSTAEWHSNWKREEISWKLSHTDNGVIWATDRVTITALEHDVSEKLFIESWCQRVLNWLSYRLILFNPLTCQRAPAITQNIHMLDGSEIGGFEFNMMASKWAKKQACLTSSVDEFHVEHFECLAAE